MLAVRVAVEDGCTDVEVEVGNGVEVKPVIELAKVVEAKVDERIDDNSVGEIVKEVEADVDRSDAVEEDEVNMDEESDAGEMSAQDFECFCQHEQTHRK